MKVRLYSSALYEGAGDEGGGDQAFHGNKDNGKSD